MAGLFFAVEARSAHRSYEDQDAGVWVLDPSWLNALSPLLGRYGIVHVSGNSPAEYLLPYERGQACPDSHSTPIAIIPDYTTPRIIAQRGTFTVFGEDKDKLEVLAADQSTLEKNLTLIRIPSDRVGALRAELDIAGITESVMYPDLAGLGAEIARRHVVPE